MRIYSGDALKSKVLSAPLLPCLQRKRIIMSRICQITGKRPRVGNNVSHSNIKSKRRFLPNLHKKKFYIPEEGKWITLKVSSTALRTIDKHGISAVLKKAKKQGNLLY